MDSSNAALAASLLLYPVLFRAVTPSTASPVHATLSREAISAAHAALISAASAGTLWIARNQWSLSSDIRPNGQDVDLTTAKQRLDIINSRSAIGNVIVAWECGYLLQDCAILFLLRVRYSVATPGAKPRLPSVLARSVNRRVMWWHHIGLASALAIFHLRALQGEAKGIMIVLGLFLMNISYGFQLDMQSSTSHEAQYSNLLTLCFRTPPGTLAWYLARFQPHRRLALVVARMTYIVSYGLFRVYLIYRILYLYGLWVDRSPFAALASLPLYCQSGTAAIGVTNTSWLILELRKFVRTYLL